MHMYALIANDITGEFKDSRSVLLKKLKIIKLEFCHQNILLSTVNRISEQFVVQAPSRLAKSLNAESPLRK